MADRQSASARLIRLLGGTGVGYILAAVLEAASPLAPIGAQALYALEPIFRSETSDWSDLGHALEDPAQLDALISSLRTGEGE